MSGEDTASAGLGALAGRLGTDYYQRGPCLECKSPSDLCTSHSLSSLLCTALCTHTGISHLHRPRRQAQGDSQAAAASGGFNTAGGEGGGNKYFCLADYQECSASITWWKEKQEGCMNLRHGPGLQGVLSSCLTPLTITTPSEPGVHGPGHGGDSQHGGSLHWPPLQSDRGQRLRGERREPDGDPAVSGVR